MLEAGPKANEGAWEADVQTDFEERQKLDGSEYTQIRT